MSYDQGNTAANLYVTNFSWSLTQDDLAALFATYGELVSVRLITDKATGRSRGFGFVEFANAEDAQHAIEKLNGAEIGGRVISVSVAKPREEKTGFAPRNGGNRSGGYSRDNNRNYGGNRNY